MNLDWAGATATVPVATKWGRSSQAGCFGDVREALTGLSETVRTESDAPGCRVNVELNAKVNRACDAAFT